MEKIASFQVDHTRLTPGMYTSRTDGDVVTYDVRFIKPNTPPYLDPPVLHTIEHLVATYVRNSSHKDGVIYFGPMGCRTGFYLLLAGDYDSREVLPLVTEMYRFIRDFRGEVPGAAAKDCGNYLDMNLGMANYLAGKYLDVLEHIDEFPQSRLVYPE